MRLLYGWIKELNYCKVEGDFVFSQKYLVSFEPGEEMLRISENATYISGFFGNNIEDITVLVGENGAGKTTMCKELLSILRGEGKSESQYMMVFENEKEIHIYCKGTDVCKLEFDGEPCSFENDLYQNKNEYSIFRHKEEDGIASRMLPFLITNGFLGSDLEKSLDAERNKPYYRSPAYLMRNAGEWAKGYYGAEWSGYLHNNSYAYASERTKDPVFEYQLYQNKLMIEGFFATKNIPLMEKFSFFKQFTMGVRPFGAIDSQTNNLCAAIINVLRRLKEMRKGILDNCYFSLLQETYLYCGLGRGEKPEPNAIGEMLIDKFKEWTRCSPSDSIIDRSFNQKLSQEIRQQVDEKNEKKPDGMRKSADEWEWYKQFKRTLEQLEDWKNDPEKNRLFQYPIKRYKFDSPEGKELLAFYRERLEEDEPFWKRTIGFNINSGSTGEIAMVNLFAYIIDLVYSWKNKPEKEIFLMIDEIDVSIHPRWQQEIICWITAFLEQQFPEYRFQLLITSHSPICLSDIPSERILKLKRREEEKIIQVSPCAEPTFGANIYDLFYDGFFMERGTIGRFAQKKIDAAIKGLLKSNVQDIEGQIPYIVKSVGESMVREQMEDLLIRAQRTQ